MNSCLISEGDRLRKYYKRWKPYQNLGYVYTLVTVQGYDKRNIKAKC